MSSDLAFEIPVDGVPVSRLRTGAEWHVGLEEQARRPASSSIKRAIDVVGAALGLVFLLPFLLVIAFFIRLESGGGPILFRQRRTGFAGETFVIYKFRTMSVAQDGDDVRHATRHDCRTTQIGRLLRRTSLDELPQLLNVLRGDMSLVGPRPHAVAHDHYYGAVVDHYRERFLVKPGITGLAQVSGHRGEIRSIGCMGDRVAYDLAYIRSWSIWLDLQILAKTLLVGPIDPAAY